MTPLCDDPAQTKRARDYVLGRLAEDDQQAFEDHLAGCHACADQVLRYTQGLERISAQALQAGSSTGWPGGFLDVWRPALPAAIAAGMVILVLGYPAFLGLYRLPRVESQPRTLSRAAADARARLEEQPRQATHRGFVGVHFLTRPARGGAGVETIVISAGQPTVYIGVPLDPFDIPSGDDTYRFEVGSAGRTVWSSVLTGAKVRAYLDSEQGAVILVSPACDLPAGDYELTVRRGDGPGSEVIFGKRFAVAR
jgi:hypothetical protein